MGEKLNLVLIIILFLLIIGLFYYVYSNLEIEKKQNEKIIVENYDVMNWSGMMRLVAECPNNNSIIAGGCESDTGWMNVFSSKPVKNGESIYHADGWECSFSQDKTGEAGVYAYAICEQ